MSYSAPLEGVAKVDALIPLVDGKRAIAKVSYGAFRFGSIWITGLDTDHPVVSWPKTTRGYPILECVDSRLREDIEKKILRRLNA